MTLTFDNGGGSPVVLTLTTSDEAAGVNTASFDPANPSASPSVANVSGGSSIPAGTYTVTLSYQDQAGDPAQTAAATNVTLTGVENPPPTAVSDIFYLPPSTQPFTLNVLANDIPGTPTDTLTIVSFTNPTGGTLQITGGGTALQYTPNSRYSGNDNFTYTISDENGDTSTATVTIINPYHQFAGNYQANITGFNPGYLCITISKLGAYTGSLRFPAAQGCETYQFNGAFDATGNTVNTITRPNASTLTLDVALNPSGAGSLTYNLDIPGYPAETGTFTQKILFSNSNPAPQTGNYTLLILPPGVGPLSQATGTATSSSNGKITSIWLTNDGGAGYISNPVVTITGANGTGSGAKAVAEIYNGSITGIALIKPGSHYQSPVTVTISAPSGLPQGYGWATMKVGNAGAVAIVGKLSDGTAFTSGSWIDGGYELGQSFNPYAGATVTIPVYAGVYHAPVGYLQGALYFEETTGVSDLDSRSTMVWCKPQQENPQSYIQGFTTPVTMIGSTYVNPQTDYLLNLQNISGNGLLTLSGAGMSAVLQNLVTLPQAPSTGATAVSGANDALILSQTPATGSFSGKFSATGSGPMTSFSGVYYQKQNLGLGFITTSAVSGSVNITPQ